MEEYNLGPPTLDDYHKIHLKGLTGSSGFEFHTRNKTNKSKNAMHTQSHPCSTVSLVYWVVPCWSASLRMGFSFLKDLPLEMEDLLKVLKNNVCRSYAWLCVAFFHDNEYASSTLLYRKRTQLNQEGERMGGRERRGEGEREKERKWEWREEEGREGEGREGEGGKEKGGREKGGKREGSMDQNCTFAGKSSQ